jgi:hypothetical protein
MRGEWMEKGQRGRKEVEHEGLLGRLTHICSSNMIIWILSVWAMVRSSEISHCAFSLSPPPPRFRLTLVLPTHYSLNIRGNSFLFVHLVPTLSLVPFHSYSLWKQQSLFLL